IATTPLEIQLKLKNRHGVQRTLTDGWQKSQSLSYFSNAIKKIDPKKGCRSILFYIQLPLST
ncbi:MAG: hypothetical protein O3B12_04370, partial [Proteobacteria bacterium]|nr:hypothetical protein [Pseudomonadota bacterium]